MLLGLFAPLVAPYDPYDAVTIDIMNSEIPPSWMTEGERGFLLGTDIQGRDLLSTMFYGLRLSIFIGIGAVLFQAFLGIGVGLVAGYVGGLVDDGIMFVTNMFTVIPTIVLLILIS